MVVHGRDTSLQMWYEGREEQCGRESSVECVVQNLLYVRCFVNVPQLSCDGVIAIGYSEANFPLMERKN